MLVDENSREGRRKWTENQIVAGGHHEEVSARTFFVLRGERLVSTAMLTTFVAPNLQYN